MILRWQPWGSRLLLPFFLLMTPAVGLMLARMNARPVAPIMIALLTACAIPFAFFNSTRPLLEVTKKGEASYGIGLSPFLRLSRDELYFMNRPALYAPYRRAVDPLTKSNCHDVGLFTTESSWEYPLWVLLRQREERVRLFHVGVTNVSAARKDNRGTPSAITAINRKGLPRAYEGRFDVAYSAQDFRVYTKKF